MLTVRCDEQGAGEHQVALHENLRDLGDNSEPALHIARASRMDLVAPALGRCVRVWDGIEMAVELECGPGEPSVPTRNHAGTFGIRMIERDVQTGRAKDARVDMRRVLLVSRWARDRYELQRPLHQALGIDALA